MNSEMQALNDAYQSGGVRALATEAERRMPPDGSHGWVGQLVAGCLDAESAVAASWLLLDHAKQGRSVPATSMERLLQEWPANVSDDARLHLCQLMSHVDVPPVAVPGLVENVHSWTYATHTFLRAWAIDAMYRLALQYPTHEAAATDALARGAEDPKASVKARVRRIDAESRKRRS